MTSSCSAATSRLGLGERLVPGCFVLLRRLVRVEPPTLELGDGAELRVAAEHDVGASTGHVRRDRDGALAAGVGDDRGLALVLLGVEHLVPDAALLQLLGEVLALLDRHGADEHGLAGVVALGDVVDDGVVLRDLGAVDEVGLVLADHRPVRRDRDDAELVDRVELGGLGLGRAGHAGELVVHAEVVLQGDRGERLVLVLDLDALLRLDRLVHALVVAPSGQHAAGVLVDDEDLAVHDDVVLVLLEQLLGLDGVVEVADERRVDGVVEVVDAEAGPRPWRCPTRARRRCASSRRPRSRRGRPRRGSGARRCGRTRRTTSSARSAGPEMMSGVRASSMRIESTSSTMQKLWPRCTSSAGSQAMLSRR